MIYRRAVVEDIEQMSEIRLGVSENILSDPSKITLAMYGDYLERLGRGWVCEIDNVIVGFVYAAKEDNSIWALFIKKQYEGAGIGKRLLQQAVTWLFSRGAEKIVLSTEANTRADLFYSYQGWTRGKIINGTEITYSLANPNVPKNSSNRTKKY